MYFFKCKQRANAKQEKTTTTGPVMWKEEPEIKLPTSTGSWKKQESSRKSSISALLTMTKPLTVWITRNWKILRNLYAGQEATVRTGHGTTDWFQRGKGVRQGCILSPCLFKFYVEYILRNLYPSQEVTVRIRHGTTDWFQAGKRIYQGCILSPCLFNSYAEYIMRNAGRNINNLRDADDTTLMAESEEEL